MLSSPSFRIILFVLLFAAVALAGNRGKYIPWNLFEPIWSKGANQAEIAALLLDPESRLEPEFKVPSTLRKRVLFWAQIYGHYDSHYRIVHDRMDPGIVYGIIDTRPFYVKGIGPQTRNRQIAAAERLILEELRRRLLAAWSGRSLAVWNELEQDDWKKFLDSTDIKNDRELILMLSNMRTQSGQKDKFVQALRRSEKLLPEMENVFKEKGLPVGLTRIPFVESSFNTQARSKAGAMGMWQFTRPTARAYIDPRNRKLWSDPMAQTIAAAKWLKKYRRSMPDWGSTITSYNSGTGRVAKMVKRHRIENGAGLVEAAVNTQHLGFAGLNFYSEVLAANLVEAYKTRIFIAHAFAPPAFVVQNAPPRYWRDEQIAGMIALPTSR